MDQFTMEKKNSLRPVTLSTKGCFDSKSVDSSKKNGSQSARKREYEKHDKKSTPIRTGWTGQRHVRPREKMGGQVEKAATPPEIGSLQRSGSKKQNFTHLDVQNWYSSPLDKYSRQGFHGHTHFGKRAYYHHAKYNKEHYMQANCQFVVIAGNDYSTYESNPDKLVDWNLIEEVRLHMTEPPSCPICLHPPIAAKITRCSHIYCFPCILHYFALSDDHWRKCPICDQVISKDELKSVVPILHKNWNCGEEIKMILMRRDRDSLVPIPSTSHSLAGTSRRIASLSSSDSVFPYDKLIMASPEEVLDRIVNRELECLNCQLAIEGNEPEACFIESAIASVSEREKKLISVKPNNSEDRSFVELKVGSRHHDFSLNSSTCEDTVDFTSDLESLAISNLDDSNFNQDNKETSLHDSSFSLKNEDKLCGENLQSTRNLPISTFYFYQESSGAHIYLHPLNIRMLRKDYGSIENSPSVIKAKIIEKESASITDELRQRMKWLGHLPISCTYETVELAFQYPLISQLTRAEFDDQIKDREKVRRRRARNEHRIEKRIEKRVRVEEDKLLGRIHSSYDHSTSLEHFPSFSASDPPLVGTSEEESTPHTVETSWSSSPPEDVFNASAPSFSKIIQEGCKQPNRPRTKISSNNISLKGAYANSSDDDEGAGVPDYKVKYSMDFDAAFAKASQKMSSSSSADQEIGKKGKKKKKRILLLSTGAH